MSVDQGPHFFRYGLFDAPIWLDGRTFSVHNGPESGVAWATPMTAYLVQALDGSHRVIRPHLGEGAPDGRAPVSFSMELMIASESDYRSLMRAEARAAAVWVCPLIRSIEVFQAVSGGSYRLSRPIAYGIVPGVNETEYETIVEIDGVENSSAATVSGRTVSALASGVLVIESTPVFACLVKISHSYRTANALVVSVSCDEGIEP
jgi:hypothetical protein